MPSIGTDQRRVTTYGYRGAQDIGNPTLSTLSRSIGCGQRGALPRLSIACWPAAGKMRNAWSYCTGIMTGTSLDQS